MNKDQVKGSMKETAGKAQEKMGEMADNKEQQRKGQEKQGEAKVDKTAGGIKDVFNK